MATRQDQRSCPGGPGGGSAGQGSGAELPTRPVTETESLSELLEDSLPSFGAAYLRRLWTLLDEAIGKGLPLTLSVSGPVTASGQHYTWLNPLLDTGWFCLVSTTDAVCYHDGHRALDGAKERPFFRVDRHGDDGELRDDRTIRVTDVGFPEDTLLEQDLFLRTILGLPEFQRSMSGTEFRALLGQRFAEQESRSGAAEGLLALCWRKAIPIFVGAPADGSVFLNSVARWTLREAFGDAYGFELDLHREVFESCAFHRWAVRDLEVGAIGALILGGGVPKNFNLQPEPALSQILGLEDVEGYLYDIQITTAPVTDGSLSSCPPAEAVTWGKVDKDAYQRTTESMPADYSMVMPILTKALLDKRDRLARLRGELGEETLLQRHPEAHGYLRDDAGYRLFDERDRLVGALRDEVRARRDELRASTEYDLA